MLRFCIIHSKGSKTHLINSNQLYFYFFVCQKNIGLHQQPDIFFICKYASVADAYGSALFFRLKIRMAALPQYKGKLISKICERHIFIFGKMSIVIVYFH